MSTAPSSRHVIVSIILLVSLSAVGQGQDIRRQKKLIATGWDKAEPESLAKNLAEMEKRPFDGVVVEVAGRIDDKRRCAMRQTFSNEKWQREWFEPAVKTLRACKFTRFTDNFITVGANPGNVDWFDDAGWRNIIEHWRIAAWLVKQSGFKGLLFDPEPYTKPWAQFGYSTQPERDKHSFDDYCAKARERGREVMRAIVAEYPDITVFTYFMNSVVATAAGHRNPRQALAALGYGLYPAFIDGWLDAVPPTVTLVDGCESAYRYNSVEEYLEAAVLIKGACQNLVSPENRAKYRAQVQVSYGIYLDAYWNPKESPWYVDGKGGSRVDRLGANVRTALRTADEYVWVYGEKFRWWPTPNKSVRQETWDEALPGCEKALRFARDPIEYARTQIADLKNAGKLANLARNGDFGSESATGAEGSAIVWKEGRPPAGWSAWQEDASKGAFTWDRETGATGKGSARAANVANGCFIQKYNVQPGEQYAVCGVRRLQGKGDASIRLRWQTGDSKWTAENQDVLLYADGPRDEWREMFGMAEVPEGAGLLVILLGIRGQTTPEDVAWFDDVQISQLK